MDVIMKDRQNKYKSVTYSNPLSMVIDRADMLFNAADVAGNGLQPDEMLLQIRLAGGEHTTFTASRWEVIFMEE